MRSCGYCEFFKDSFFNRTPPGVASKVVIMQIMIKETIMEIEKALINDRLSVLKVSWKLFIPTIYNFIVTVYNLTVSIVFSVYKQNFTAQ